MGGSASAERAAWHRAMHIVGTPSRIVVPVSVISASVASGSKRRTIAIAAPEVSVEKIPVARPRTCEKGAAPSIDVLFGERERIGAVPGCRAMLPCVRIAPFGRPDVPDVKRIAAGSKPSRSTISSSGSPAPSTSLSRKTRGVDTSSRDSISGRASSRFNGTMIAPSLSAPSAAARNPGPLGSISATRSPGSTPRARKAAAATRAWRSISA